MRGTLRWMAPEVISPEKFGFTGEYRKRLPSRSTDIYTLGMTILEVRAFAPHCSVFISHTAFLVRFSGCTGQVITGCPPFNSVLRWPAVMYKIIEGDRPGRPSSGFSDQLWELLVSTWCAEYGSQPSKRPSTSVVLDRLGEDVHNWGKSIIPPTPVQKGASQKCGSK